MKILLFANTDWYLYNFRQNLARELLARGDEVVLASPRGAYAGALRNAGFSWREVKIRRRSLGPLTALSTLLAVYRLYRAVRPDLVHHFTVKCVIIGSLAARLCGVGCIVNSVAGLGYTFTSRSLRARLLRPLVNMLLKLTLAAPRHRLIVQNPEDGRLLQRLGLVRPEVVRLIRGSGVDTERFRPGSVSRGSTLRVLLATRLLWDKGVREFVEASRLLRNAGVPVEFLLAGSPDEGNPDAVPAEHVARWCDEGVLKALGHVADMPPLFNSVDVVVLPTTYGEGVPKVLLEAAACGLPIVATDAPGCREIVQDGVTGLLIPARDPGALAAALRRLAESPRFRESLGSAARRKALAEFDQQIILAETCSVYQELAAETDTSEVIGRATS